MVFAVLEFRKHRVVAGVRSPALAVNECVMSSDGLRYVIGSDDLVQCVKEAGDGEGEGE